MSLEIFIINCMLALILLGINVLIGHLKQNAVISFHYSSFKFKDLSGENFAGNFFHLIVHPAIFLAIVASIMQSIDVGFIARDLWLVVPLYWALRGVIAFIRNTIELLNLKFEITAFIISIIISEGTLFFIIRPLIDSNETVFISLTQFRDAFWFAAFTYLATLLWNVTKSITTGDKVYPARKTEMTIIHRYKKFHKRYNCHIGSVLNDIYLFTDSILEQHFTCLLYSIMIYEDYNRPCLIRGLEYVGKFFNKNTSYTLGIMQIDTKTFISSKKSISLAIQKMYPVFTLSDLNTKLYDTITNYNTSQKYYEEVLSIYETLKKHLKLEELETPENLTHQ